MNRRFLLQNSLGAGLLGAALLATATTGCKAPGSANQSAAAPTPAATQPAPRSDQDIANDIQSRINGESALNGQNIQVSVNNGTATLNGSVNNDAARALASNDAGAISGVKTVLNNLTVAPATQAAAAETPAPRETSRDRDRSSSRRRQEAREASRNRASDTAQQTPPPPAQTPYQEPVRTVPAAPPPPPAPVAKTVTIPSGAPVPVRLTEGLDSATAQPGQVFRGTLANDLISDGMVAVPRGATVIGRVVDAKDATHFAGAAMLSVELTAISTNGRQIPVVTNTYVQQGKGRGKNTATKAGGGAALGAIIGALAGGGKGAAIGAASGGGLGAGVNAVTRGEQVKLPSETLISFQLQSPLSVTTSRSASGTPNYSDDNSPQLQPR